jgi:hypothetical protein
MRAEAGSPMAEPSASASSACCDPVDQARWIVFADASSLPRIWRGHFDSLLITKNHGLSRDAGSRRILSLATPAVRRTSPPSPRANPHNGRCGPAGCVTEGEGLPCQRGRRSSVSDILGAAMIAAYHDPAFTLRPEHDRSNTSRTCGQ